jgi:hypothetical protein
MFRLLLYIELARWMRREWRHHRPRHTHGAHRYHRRYRTRVVVARRLINDLYAEGWAALAGGETR